MHCSPDLVTVLYPAGSFVVCCCAVGWLVLPLAVPPPPTPLCAWLLGVHGLLEDNLYKPNSSEKKKEQSEMTIQYTVAVLSPLSVLL